MSLRFLKLVALVWPLVLAGCGRARMVAPVSVPAQQSVITRPAGVLRVCSDPNNLPFSKHDGSGFENKIADLFARELGQKLEYTWWPQRRGFIRNTLKAGSCDVIMGLPTGLEMALTTGPYYRSSYVFVSRRDRNLKVESFDDPRLREIRIGVQMIGDDFNNAPPAHALSRRGIISNVKGFTVYGDYAKPTPAAPVVDAVINKDIDVAIVWGPLAGYFQHRHPRDLSIVPVSPQIDQPFLPFVYDISVGVRRGDQELHDELEHIIETKRDEIDHILADYGVPRMDAVKGGPPQS